MELHRVRHDWSDLACMHALKKEMATHSSILAWRIPDTEEPGGLPSMGSHRFGHDRSDLAAEAVCHSVFVGLRFSVWDFCSESVKPILMVGWHRQLNENEFAQTQGADGQGGLAYCSPWVCKELDITERLNNNNLDYILWNNRVWSLGRCQFTSIRKVQGEIQRNRNWSCKGKELTCFFLYTRNQSKLSKIPWPLFSRARTWMQISWLST